MQGIGNAGSMPRVKPGDYERALAIVTALGGDRATKVYLKEVQAATAAQDHAAEASKEHLGLSQVREEAARKAEEKAIRERQALADESAKVSAELGRRERAIAAREEAVAGFEETQATRARDLDHRYGLLVAAGVTFPDEEK